MRIRLYLLLFVGVLLVGNSCRRTTQPPASGLKAAAEQDLVAPKGFVSLFNGTNLHGWNVRQADNQDWQIVDGVIDCDPHEDKGDRNLWTNGSYGDFELMGDWRIKKSPFINRVAKIILPDGTYKEDDYGKEILIEVPNTDSGIFLRGRHKSQVNIWCWPIGSGEVWGYRTDPAFSVARPSWPRTRAGSPRHSAFWGIIRTRRPGKPEEDPEGQAPIFFSSRVK